MDFRRNIITLSFLDRDIESVFRKINAENSVFQARLAVILGILLYSAFSFLDYLLVPDGFPPLFVIRFTVVVIFIFSFVMTYIIPKKIELVTIVALFAAQCGHYGLMVAGDFPSSYGYGTTIIIMIFMLTFSRILFAKAVAVAAIFIIVYEALIISVLKYPLIDILKSNYFLLSVTIAGILAGYTIERHIRLDYVNNINLNAEKAKSEQLLLNILPKNVAMELMEKGTADPVGYDSVTVLFSDFVDFTKIAEQLSPAELVDELSSSFCLFDSITKKYNLEKIKTIGDCYMLAGGVPVSSENHAIECVKAAIEIKECVNRIKQERESAGLSYWGLRIGIHTGPLVAGVVGEMKFAYDIFGDTVNVASRIETNGLINEINISQSTYNEIKDYFHCETLGKVNMKGKGPVEIYVVKGMKEPVSASQA